jgi:hypothetical protein
MLRSKPKLSYAGLTVVLSNPSRFDKFRLLSANGGMLFDKFCLQPELNSMMTDVRLADETEPLLPNTKCLLLLGEYAAQKYLGAQIKGNILNEIRGALYDYKGIPAIASYLPQDCTDFKNYEAELNPLSKSYQADDSVSDGEDEDEGDVKRMGKTKRSNYAFWLRADVKKCKYHLRRETMDKESEVGVCPIWNKVVQTYRIYPPTEEILNALRGHKNETLYLDIETDMEEGNLQCFSFSFDGYTIYSVPILDYNYSWAYGSLHYIMRMLSVAIRDNIVVAHNGANFDFFILGHKYHIPIVRTYDTMIANHRCFPDIEKSLGHCGSLWTWEKFHKDENSIAYRTQEQMMDRLRYCAKDVYLMYLIKQGIDKYAKTIPGLEQSISDAMRCIRPYLTSTLQGIRVDKDKRDKKILENDRLMMQYNRMIELLIGETGLQQCRSIIKGKPSLFAGSNTQCTHYFHNLLGYPVVARGKPHKITGDRKPSLGKKALYKLALSHDNPVINLICAYRATAKETSRLQFEPYEQPTNKLCTQKN